MATGNDREVERLLKENLRLTRENNKLLKKIRRSHTWALIMRIVFVLLVIGVPYILYQLYFKDTVDEFMATYQGLQEDVQDIKAMPGELVPDVIKDRF
jgi:Tfp pilus assembly protein PilO